MTRKKLERFIVSCGVLLVCNAFPVFAAEGIAVIKNNTANENIGVEAMIDGASYILTADNEYRVSFECNTDEPQIVARVIDDPYEVYTCTWEEPIDLSSKNVITIEVNYSASEDTDAEEAGSSDTVDPNSIDWDAINYGIPDTPAEEIDLSNGATETGTLVVECEPIYAFESVTLTLQDEKYKDYNITLHLSPYFFKARVKLPAGKYRETGTPQVKYQENVSTNGTPYSWIRTGKTAFGGFIEVPAGGEVDITDYKIVQSINGEAQSINSAQMLEKRRRSEESQIQKKQDEEFYHKTYQNLTLETEAPTQPQKVRFSIVDVLKKIVKYLPYVGGVAVVVMLACIIVRLIQMYKDNNRRH